MFYLISKDLDHGVKMRQNFVFLFLISFVIYLRVFDLFGFSNFSKIPVVDGLDILS